MNLASDCPYLHQYTLSVTLPCFLVLPIKFAVQDLTDWNLFLIAHRALSWFHPLFHFVILSCQNKQTKQSKLANTLFRLTFPLFSTSTLFCPIHQFRESSLSYLQLICSSLPRFSSSILEFKDSHIQKYHSYVLNTLFLHNISIFTHWITYTAQCNEVN